MTVSVRSRVGIPLAVGLGALALLVCALPWIPLTREALGITGNWVDPSPYYVGAFVTAGASLLAAVALVQWGEAKAWKVVAIVLGVLGALAALASLALSAMMSIGMSG